MPRPNPTERAEVLLKETSLTAYEIAEMTGLDVYQVFGMKLKSRSYKFRPQTHKEAAQHYAWVQGTQAARHETINENRSHG